MEYGIFWIAEVKGVKVGATQGEEAMEGKGRMVLMWLFFQNDKKVGAETEEFMRAVSKVARLCGCLPLFV